MRSMRKEHVEGGNAGPDEEAKSEERDATIAGESSHERARGGGLAKGVENIPTEKKIGRESAPQEAKKGGEVRHKRARGGKVPGKAAKGHPGRRARGGGTTADLHPNTAAGSMQEPSYMRDTEGNSSGGSGGDSRGGMKIVKGGGRD